MTNCVTDMIPSDEDNTGDGPQLDKHHPECVTKRTLVVVDHTNSERGAGLLPGLIDQCRGDNILYAGPSIGAGDADQELQTVCHHGNDGGREQGQQGEHGLPGPVGVSPSLSQEERLEVVAESDGDNGEVGAESEDRK